MITLSEAATRELPLTFPGALQAATRQLAATRRALVGDGPCQPPGLAFSAVAQLTALQGDVTAAAENGFGSAAGATPGTGTWASIEHTLDRVGKGLWSLISHLFPVSEWSWTEQASAGLPASRQVPSERYVRAYSAQARRCPSMRRSARAGMRPWQV
ncbi:MAG: hypothetical protein ACR2MP_06950 [Streptosporangiaceae bacterium]